MASHARPWRLLARRGGQPHPADTGHDAAGFAVAMGTERVVTPATTEVVLLGRREAWREGLFGCDRRTIDGHAERGAQGALDPAVDAARRRHGFDAEEQFFVVEPDHEAWAFGWFHG